jgi:hypothetical protein
MTPNFQSIIIRKTSLTKKYPMTHRQGCYPALAFVDPYSLSSSTVIKVNALDSMASATLASLQIPFMKLSYGARCKVIMATMNIYSTRTLK